MKKFAFIAAVPLLVFLFGCPVGLDFAPGTPGKEKIDAELVGTWETTAEDPEFAIATISKKDDFTLHASLAKTGSMFTLEETELTAWNTAIDGQKIIYAKSGEQYFIYGYKIEKAGLTLYDIALLDGGIDAVKSTETLRKQISTSLKKPECLNDGRLYTKK